MVIAVQTPLSRVVFDYQYATTRHTRTRHDTTLTKLSSFRFLFLARARRCSGRTLAVDPKDATRPVMGALVSTVWGVAPTHQAWDPLHNRIKENYLWAVHTPSPHLRPPARSLVLFIYFFVG
jgi:hypothetical protein